MTVSLEYLAKLDAGIDVVLNAPSNIDVMGRILTSDNAGIIPSRSAYREDAEVVI